LRGNVVEDGVSLGESRADPIVSNEKQVLGNPGSPLQVLSSAREKGGAKWGGWGERRSSHKSRKVDFAWEQRKVSEEWSHL